MPLRVVLDTSVLHDLAPRGTQAAALKELAQKGLIEVHVPAIVEQELATHLAALFPANMIKRALSIAMRWAPEAEIQPVQQCLEQTHALLRSSDRLIARGVAEWLEQLGAVRSPVSAVDTSEVFRRYFQGAPPFKAPKSREDLPDAFILAAIEALAADGGEPVHVLTADARLSEACAKLQNVQVHRKLSDLLALPENQPAVSEAHLRDYVRRKSAQLVEELRGYLREDLESSEVFAQKPVGESTSSYVILAAEPKEVSLDLDRVQVFSESAVSIPYTCVVTGVRADHYILKTDYRELTLELGFRPIPGLSRQYVGKKDNLELHIRGEAAISISRDESGQLRVQDMEEFMEEIEVRGG
jgi:predicted nucleic acid-binding protein